MQLEDRKKKNPRKTLGSVSWKKSDSLLTFNFSQERGENQVHAQRNPHPQEVCNYIASYGLWLSWEREAL